MLIAGVDPGVTTGLVVIRWSGELPLDSSTVDVVETAQRDFPGTVEWLGDWFGSVDHVAVERFHITGRTVQATRQYEPLYVIGGILFMAATAEREGREGPVVKLISASNAKNAWTNDRIKAAGLYDGLKGMQHARDALRHALLRCHTINSGKNT